MSETPSPPVALPLALVLPWAFREGLLKLGFKDNEIKVGTVATLSSEQAGDPIDRSVSVCVTVTRNKSVWVAALAPWPPEFGALTIEQVWKAFCAGVMQKKITPAMISASLGKISFEREWLRRELQARELLPADAP